MSGHVKIGWESMTPKRPERFDFASRRSVVYSSSGMVCATQPLAVKAGLEILRAGGNAADAAVATAAALNVTEPCSTGIGGDMFCLYYNAKEKRVQGLNGSGRSPKALSLERARENGHAGREISLESMDSVTVPGTVAGWCDTIAHFGSGDLALDRILAPAIKIAKDGAPISELAAHMWHNSEGLLRRTGARSMLIDGRRAPHAGEIMIMPELAETFEEIAKHGKDGFYKGRVAHAIVDAITSRGGCMTLADLADHTSTRVDSIAMSYGDPRHASTIELHECPPNGQGITACLALGIVEELQKQGKIKPLEELGHNSAEYLHVVIEALRLAFADTRYFVSDPEFGKGIPLEELLSPAYIAKRASAFDASRANESIRHGTPANISDTVYFTTADEQGNACSFIMSNYDGFGTGVVPEGTGFTLHNRGSNFVLQKGHPNCLEGGKRPYHTIIPAMVTRDKELWLSYGVMGGFMQPQGHLQVLLNILHFRMGLQAALDAPRVCLVAAMPDLPDPEDALDDDEGDVDRARIYLEQGISSETLETLRSMGHDVQVSTGFDRARFGRGQIIRKRLDPRTKRVVWEGASDPRGDGHAGPS